MKQKYGILDEDLDGDVDTMDYLIGESEYNELCEILDGNKVKNHLEDTDDYEEEDVEPFTNYTKDNNDTDSLGNITIELSFKDTFEFIDVENEYKKKLFEKYPKLNTIWNNEDEFLDILEEEFKYNKRASYQYIDFFINTIKKKDIKKIKDYESIYYSLILEPMIQLIYYVDFDYNTSVLQYWSAPNRLEHFFACVDWNGYLHQQYKRYLSVIMDFFEICKKPELAIQSYELFQKYQKKNFTKKELGIFWKDKNLEFTAKNKNLYDFYHKTMKSLGEFGTRPLLKLEKIIKSKN